MKTFETFFIDVTPDNRPSLEQSLAECTLPGLASDLEEYPVHVVRLQAGTSQHACLRDHLRSFGLTWDVHRENTYSDEDLRAAPLVRVVVTSAPRGLGGPEYGTTYDLTEACQACGTGAQQTSALVLRAGDPKDAVYQTLTGEILVSRELRDDMVATVDTAGFELREAVGRSGTGLDYFQLLPHRAMPPMSPSAEGLLREQPCPTCERDGYFESVKEPLRIRYEVASDRELDAAAYFTYEWFWQLRAPYAVPEEQARAPPALKGPTR